ncbi:hypothetical protein [Pseudonocardia aurantiaca]|uniref:Uncharacterized protein n=1 Tax=Pseudonocardia aurantiaca TaxID=75290 RepID=A0ABW4FXA5_9PSEU
MANYLVPEAVFTTLRFDLAMAAAIATVVVAVGVLTSRRACPSRPP